MKYLKKFTVVREMERLHPNVGRGTSLHEAFCDFEWFWSARDPDNACFKKAENMETTCLTINGLWRKQCYGIFMCDGSGMFRVRSLIHQIVHSGFGPVVLQLYREDLKDESQASITQNQISSW